MDEQTNKGNQYTYDGRTDKRRKSIYLRWMNRETRAINLPRMDEQTVKSNQYTYDGLTDKQGQWMYLRWRKSGKGNQYT